MSTVNIVWNASEQLRKEELTQTGEETRERRSLKLDLIELTEEQRAAIVEFAGVNLHSIDLTSSTTFNESRSYTRYRESTKAYFDAQPTIAQVLAHITTTQAELDKANAYKAQVDAEEKAEKERKTALYNKLRLQLEMLIEASDYDAINTFNTGGLGDWSPGRKDSLYTLCVDAMAEIRIKRAAADKWAWIQEHGSDHLRQCLERGYDCQRLYVIERAAIEAPAFTVDFNDAAKWDSRSCPSEAAIQAEIEADALGLTASPAQIVWLTAPPSHRIPDPYDDEPEWFEACEAVVVRRYLDKYDLVQTIE